MRYNVHLLKNKQDKREEENSIKSFFQNKILQAEFLYWGLQQAMDTEPAFRVNLTGKSKCTDVKIVDDYEIDFGGGLNGFGSWTRKLAVGGASLFAFISLAGAGSDEAWAVTSPSNNSNGKHIQTTSPVIPRSDFSAKLDEIVRGNRDNPIVTARFHTNSAALHTNSVWENAEIGHTNQSWPNNSPGSHTNVWSNIGAGTHTNSGGDNHTNAPGHSDTTGGTHSNIGHANSAVGHTDYTGAPGHTNYSGGDMDSDYLY